MYYSSFLLGIPPCLPCKHGTPGVPTTHFDKRCFNLSLFLINPEQSDVHRVFICKLKLHIKKGDEVAGS